MGEDTPKQETKPVPQQQNANDKGSNDKAHSGPGIGGGTGGPGFGSGGPGFGGRGGRGGGRGGPGDRRGGSRFSSGRGGGPGGRNMDGPKMNDMDGGNSEGMGGGMGGGMSGMGGRGGMRGRGRGGGPGGDRGGMMNRSQDDRLMERIMNLSGPTHELPPQDSTEKKFSGRNRLYVGNLTNDVSEEEITQMFSPFGEVSEIFINKEKNFAFLKIDYRINAEKAKHQLDGSVRKGRALKVRFAPSSATVKVKNLTPWVSNELLERAFSVFGEIERSVVIVDERGKSTGEGIVEFARKPCAQQAIRKCTDGCYFLTASLRPVVAETYEPQDDIDGYPDKNLPKKHPEFFKAREVGPRFAQIGSFEHEYGTRWKQLHELYKQKEEALKREMVMEEEKLEAQMEFARYEHETEILRDQLRMREADRDRQKREWEMKERQAEEQRTREEDLRRRQQEEMTLRIRKQEEELHRRQQENNLFMQEQALRGGKNYDTVNNADEPAGNLPVDPKSFMEAYDRNNRGGFRDDRGQIMDLMDMRVDMGMGGGNMGGGNMGGGNMGSGNMGGGSMGGGNMGGGGIGGGNMGGGRGGGGGAGGAGGRWQGANDRNRPDDFPNKRRRY